MEDDNRLESRVFEEGIHLLTTNYYNQKVLLYSVGFDYVEVYYSQNENEITRITKATKYDLHKHLSRLDIGLENLL